MICIKTGGLIYLAQYDSTFRCDLYQHQISVDDFAPGLTGFTSIYIARIVEASRHFGDLPDTDMACTRVLHWFDRTATFSTLIFEE